MKASRTVFKFCRGNCCINIIGTDSPIINNYNSIVRKTDEDNGELMI
jgi:hypothetical protein